MINNYAKDKLLMPAKKKKYTREHIILMILLYEMKQILTISDIKALFGTIVKEDHVNAKKLEEIYQIYLTLKKKGIDDFKQQVEKVGLGLGQQLEESSLTILENKEVEEAGRGVAESLGGDNKSEATSQTQKVEPKIEDMLLVIMLTQRANYYKRLAEKIIDEKIKINESVQIVEAATGIVSSMGSIEKQNQVILTKVKENKEVSEKLSSLMRQFKLN